MVLKLPPPIPRPAKPPSAPPPLPAPFSHSITDPVPEEGSTTARFKSNVNIEFRTKSSVSHRDRLAALLASLQRADPHCTILPLPDYPTAPLISSPTEVPVETSVFHQYLTLPKPTRTGSKHHLFLSTHLRINQLKNHPIVINHLRSSNIWIRYNTVSSTNITAVGWMFRTNPDAYSRNDLYDHMVEALGGQLTAFQLNSRNITHHSDGKLTTRAWVLEMDKTLAKQWFKTLLETFPIGGTGPQLVPFSAAGHNRDQSLRKVFLLHNKSLTDSELLRIDNLRGLDAIIYDKNNNLEPTLRLSFLDQKLRSDPNVSLFHSVSQYNSGRVVLLLRREHLQEAQELIDHFLDIYIPSLLETSQQLITFQEKPPIRIGRPSFPDHIAVLTKAIDTLPIELDFDDSSQLTPFSNPPPKYQRTPRSYATAVTGPSTAAATPAVTATSELTPERSTHIDRLLHDLSQKTKTLEHSQLQTSAAVSKLQTQLETTLLELTTMKKLLHEQQGSIYKITDMLSRIEPLLHSSRPSSPHSLARKQPRSSLSLSSPSHLATQIDTGFDFDPDPDPDIPSPSQQ